MGKERFAKPLMSEAEAPDLYAFIMAGEKNRLDLSHQPNNRGLTSPTRKQGLVARQKGN